MSELPMNRTPALLRLGDYPAHWARATPDAEAIVDGDRRLSYAEFEAQIAAVARALLVAGVKRGDRVAMLATACLEHLVHYLAAARIGATWLGLNPRYRLDEFRHVLSDARPSLVVAMLEIEGRSYLEELNVLGADVLAGGSVVALRGSAPGFIDWDDFVASGAGASVAMYAEAAAGVLPDDPALIVYTSGSTGKPKGALLSHRAIVTSARIQCEHWWAQPFRILNNAPINHIGGAIQITCHALVAGGTNVLMDRFDPAALPGVIQRERVTVIHQVATMYQILLDKVRPAPAAFASLQLMIWSGSAAPRGLIARLRAYCPNLFTSYGMTETGGEVLYMPAGADDDTLALCVGLPDAHIPLRLGHVDGSGATPEPSGEIQIQGPTVMSGYLGLPEATAAAYTADGWLRTGDIGERQPDGYYRITGRLREMFKSGGYNIYPREIELVLEKHPGVEMAAVVSLPDPVYNEIGHAWVLVRAGDPRAPSAEELLVLCREHLANYKVPKLIHVRENLPMLPIHKLDKVALRQWSLENLADTAH